MACAGVEEDLGDGELVWEGNGREREGNWAGWGKELY